MELYGIYLKYTLWNLFEIYRYIILHIMYLRERVDRYQHIYWDAMVASVVHQARTQEGLIGKSQGSCRWRHDNQPQFLECLGKIIKYIITKFQIRSAVLQLGLL